MNAEDYGYLTVLNRSSVSCSFVVNEPAIHAHLTTERPHRLNETVVHACIAFSLIRSSFIITRLTKVAKVRATTFFAARFHSSQDPPDSRVAA